MNKKRILIIDDDKVFLESIEIVLTLKGFEVATVTSATSALEVLNKSIPDLVLLDVRLPDKSGFEVLRSIKLNEHSSKTPVIMMTGDITVQIDKAFAEGADDCVFKPVNIYDLMKVINRLLK